MGRSGELLKVWLKIFQQIDDSGFNHVLAILQNMVFWSVLRAFYPQEIPKIRKKCIFSAFLGYKLDAPISSFQGPRVCYLTQATKGESVVAANTMLTFVAFARSHRDA